MSVDSIMLMLLLTVLEHEERNMIRIHFIAVRVIDLKFILVII